MRFFRMSCDCKCRNMSEGSATVYVCMLGLLERLSTDLHSDYAPSQNQRICKYMRVCVFLVFAFADVAPTVGILFRDLQRTYFHYFNVTFLQHPQN